MQINRSRLFFAKALLSQFCLLSLFLLASSVSADVTGWLNWRGPDQNGTSAEKGLPDQVDPAKPLWTLDIAGRGTPVIARYKTADGFEDRVFAWGYEGDGADMKEYLICLNPATGKEYWRHGFSDFISDNIYLRYTIGAPVVDSETGHVFVMAGSGLVTSLDKDGKILWQHSLMEKIGRMTFPNGRVGAPVIAGDLVIFHGVSSSWGRNGPPADRFFAFDKKTGEQVWISKPGVGPPQLKDSSFSTPILATYPGQPERLVFYAGLGCGNVACVDVATGKPIWRYQMSFGGVNSSPVLHNDHVIVIHGKENMDSSKIGRMVALKQPAEITPGKPVHLNPEMKRDYELWRNDGVTMFTSSAALVGDRVYQIVHQGDLYCIDAKTGKTIWDQKLGSSQLHASPLFADGKLYAPIFSGDFWVLKLNGDEKDGLEVLSKVKLDGNCIGSPAAWNGKLYVHTTEKLYCFGSAEDSPSSAAMTAMTYKLPAAKPAQEKLPATEIRVIPIEVLLTPGETASFKLVGLDQFGRETELKGTPSWEKFIPPTAKVKVKLDADFNDKGELKANPNARYSAGAFKVTMENQKGEKVSGFISGRILPQPPFVEDFNSYEPTLMHKADQEKFAYPPLPWIGARFKWDIRERDGERILVKTLDRVIWQRSTIFIGDPNLSDYTIQADVKTDGNRRMMGEIGVVCQRYNIVLKGNHQQIEVNSNHERLKVGKPFRWKAKKWYTLKAQVEVKADGSGVIRGKAWLRGEKEPEGWNIEVTHKDAHKKGSAGLFGLAPQNKVRVYFDNVKVTPNTK